MALQIKDNILKFLGYLLLFFGLFIFFVGIGMYIDKDSKHSKSGLPIAVASSAIYIPGIILILLGRKAAREEELLKSIASIVKSYRRITLSDMAQKLNVAIPEAGRLLSKAISMRLIKGNFDRTTDEFYTDDAREQKLEFRFCPGCGSHLDRVFLEGETVKCQSCGLLMD